MCLYNSLFVCNLLSYCSQCSLLAHELIKQYSYHLETLGVPTHHSPTDAANHLKVLHDLKFKLVLRNGTPQMWSES